MGREMAKPYNPKVDEAVRGASSKEWLVSFELSD
jgi:hypothetical protein